MFADVFLSLIVSCSPFYAVSVALIWILLSWTVFGFVVLVTFTLGWVGLLSVRIALHFVVVCYQFSLGYIRLYLFRFY
jgi:hypothetical protein